MLRARVGKVGSVVWGQARPCVSEEEEVLAAEKADAAMAALLAEESAGKKEKQQGGAGAVNGRDADMAARGRKRKGGSGKKH